MAYKSLLFLIEVYLCIMSNAYIPDVNDKIMEYCAEDAGITANIVQGLLTNPDKEFIDEESCYVHCTFIETGFLSEDGDIIIQKFQELKKSVLPGIDLDCLENIKKLDNCKEMMLLRTCHL